MTPVADQRILDSECEMDQALSAFGLQAQSWSPFFVTRVRIALALREDDRWRLWYSHTAFLPDALAQQERLDVRTETVLAFREVLAMDDAATSGRIIAELLENPGRVSIGDFGADLGPSVQHLTFEYEPLHLNRFAGASRLPALTVAWFNQHYRPFSGAKQLDQELQRHDEPFDGFADLALALGIPVGFDDLNKRRFSEVVLLPPVGVLVDANENPRSELNKGELSLVLRAHPALPMENLRVGVKAIPQRGLPDRFTLDSASFTRDTAGLLRAKHALSSQDVPIVQIFVSSEGDLLGKWWIRDFGNSFNDRMLLHRSLDVNDQLKSSFFERPEQFEDKVQLLLTLVGLTALKYGRILTNGPDILAISTSRHVFVVECTTGDINSRGKLQRLSERTKQVRDRLSNSSNPPVGVVGVVFTSLPKEETSMHWDTAATFQIAIAARENIAGLLDALDAPVDPDRLYAATLALIPSRKIEPQGALDIGT
jgi:hypothetical protein